MAHEKNHDYHILTPSIWPFIAAVSAFLMLFGAVLWFSTAVENNQPFVFLMGFVGVLYCMYAWWSDVVTESKVGDHTPVVRIGLRYGFILFIMSEVMFFSRPGSGAFFKNAMYPMGPESPARRRRLATPSGSRLRRSLASAVDQHADPVAVRAAAATWAHHAIDPHDEQRGKDMASTG